MKRRPQNNIFSPPQRVEQSPSIAESVCHPPPANVCPYNIGNTIETIPSDQMPHESIRFVAR